MLLLLLLFLFPPINCIWVPACTYLNPTLHQLPFCKVCNNRKHMEPDYNLSSRCQNFNRVFLGTCWLNRWGNWKFKLFLLYLPKTFHILLQILGWRFNFTDLSRTMCCCSTFILNMRFERYTERVETKNITHFCFLLICVWCVWNMQSLSCRPAALCMSCNVDHRVGASSCRVDADSQHVWVLRIWSCVCKRWSK